MRERRLPERRHAEVVGGGFAGLATACALAQRGWSVRVHERSGELRTTGAGIYIYENGLRVLEALGAFDEAVQSAPVAHTREVRDDRNRVVSVHRWERVSRVYSIARQQVINALASTAQRHGALIVTGSEPIAARATGELELADGSLARADLIVAADGCNSKLRDKLGLLRTRKYMPDGAIRVMIDRQPEDSFEDGTTIEYWSGSRRILYTPCSATEIYIALTMLHEDGVAKSIPIDVGAWQSWFPHLAPLLGRVGDKGRYDRFELIRLKRWSSGLVAIVGDAAHALPPNLGQGGGCAMMNALSLAVSLETQQDVASALAAWERDERPLTEHTQRMSVLFGLPTTWPAWLRGAFFSFAGRSKFMIAQRTRTARHKPTGTFDRIAPPAAPFGDPVEHGVRRG